MRPADTTPALSSSNGQPHGCKSVSACQELSARTKTVLLVDHDAVHREQIIEILTSRGHRVDLYASVVQAAKCLRQIDAEYELIIVNVSDSSQQWIRLLRFLLESAIQSRVAVRPSLLCVSSTEYDELFELQIEQMGGRLEYER
jgi:PleD family two-component response regulator